MAIDILPVESPRDLERFIDLPWRLYARDRVWVPPLRSDVRLMFDTRRNPFFAHASVQAFLAVGGGDGERGERGLAGSGTNGAAKRVIGRIAAIDNRAHVDFHGENAGFFGFFECEDDREAADALFDAAARWLAPRGLSILRGPMSFSTNDECGSLIEGFDTPPSVLMPHNPPYYARLYDAAGFTKAKDLLAYDLPSEKTPERIARGVELIKKRRGFVVRSLRMSEWDAEIRRIWEIYNSAWEKNWGFVPMTWDEMAHMAKQLKPVVEPELVVFVEDAGTPVAFAIALPDLNQALRHANGRLFPFGAIAIWLKMRSIDSVRVITLGIREGFRASGIDTLLYDELFSRARKLGYARGELSWVLEDNLAIRTPLERAGARVRKVNRVYARRIALRPGNPSVAGGCGSAGGG
jgi:hypothetical protein